MLRFSHKNTLLIIIIMIFILFLVSLFLWAYSYFGAYAFWLDVSICMEHQDFECIITNYSKLSYLGVFIRNITSLNLSIIALFLCFSIPIIYKVKRI